MDRLLNPYTPNAGARPPVLVGREPELDDFRILLERLLAGHTEQSMLVTGLRGVGKTVLLNRFEDLAEQSGWVTVQAEIGTRSAFGERFAVLVRKALFGLAPRPRWSDRARRAARILQSFKVTMAPDGSVSGSVEFDVEEGLGDSGVMVDDVTDVLVGLGEAAAEAGKGVVFLLDELQFLDLVELEALVSGLHRVVQRSLPVTLVGAGLPQLPELAGDARSYAERLFKFPRIGRLSRDEVEVALNEPARGLSVEFTSGAVDRIFEFTEGYPYFVQEFGKIVWDNATEARIFSTEAAAAESAVMEKLDRGFFRVRTERLSPGQLTILRGAAEIGAGPHLVDDVAGKVALEPAEIQREIGELIRKALLYSPRFGYVGFTVPHYDRFLRRTYPFHGGRVVLSDRRP